MGLGDIPFKGDKKARIRHIINEETCGYKLPDGRSCVIRHEYPGQPCYLHTPVPKQALRPYRIYEGMASMQKGVIARTKATALQQLLGNSVSEEDNRLLVALTADESALQDIDSLLKLRILALENQRKNHEITQKQYDDTFFRLSEQIRKNLETMMKAKLAQAQLSKDDPDRFGEDAFNPAQLYNTEE